MFLLSRPREFKSGFRGWLAYLFPIGYYTTNSARIDFWIWLLNGLLIVPAFQFCVLFSAMVVGVGFHEILTNVFGATETAVTGIGAAVAVQFFGNYLGFGFGQYAGHLAFHKVPWLWAIHRAHHSAESPNLFAFFRSHPVEIFLNGATRVIGAAVGTGVALYFTGGVLLSETVTLLFWYNVIYVLTGFRSVDHTHIPIRYGKVLDIVIGSPIMHQVHHSAELRHRDVNMGGAGYVYDWIFGTAYVPKRGETWRWGLNDEELGAHNPHQSLRDFFVEPLVSMWRSLNGKSQTSDTIRVDSKRAQ